MLGDAPDHWLAPPADLSLDAGEVHVWRASLDVDEGALADHAAFLSDDERERAGKFHFPKDHNHFVAARAILRLLLSRYLRRQPGEIRFAYAPRGKPLLEQNPTDLRFNLAHSHGWAIFGFAAGAEIGVDIEYRGRAIAGEDIAERFFSREEVAALRALPSAGRTAAFFNCWTRKEAFVKATGEGIAYGLDQFAVSLTPGEPAKLLSTRFDPAEASRWTLCHVEPGPGYVGAIAVQGPIARLRCWQWQNG